MATTTTNFGWDIPQSTDLVKDGATAIATLGQDIDTALVDLKGGTTGQLLAKNSNTNLDYIWVDPSTGDITGVTAGTGISGGGTGGDVTITNSMATAIDAKGDLIAGTGADTFSRLAVGTNNQVLVADSTAATGIKWATPSSGALTKVVSTTFSGVSSQAFQSCFTSTYRSYVIQIAMLWGSSRCDMQLQFYTGTSTLLTNYSGGVMKIPTTGTPTTGFAHSYVSTFTIGQMPSESSGQRAGGQIFINSAQQLDTGGYGSFSAESITQSGGGINDRNGFVGALNIDGNDNCTGFLLKPSTGTFNGTVTVYGLEK